MIKKDIFNKYGLFDETLPVCEDYDLWLRITGFEEIGFISTPLIIKYGGHLDQLSKKYEAMDKYRIISMLKLFYNKKLADNKKKILRDTIIKKSNILLKGAIKRKKYDDVKIYSKWIEDVQ
jgi:hypothetical protein